MAYIGRNPAIGTQKVLDSLESQFNGVLTTFDLRYNTNTIYPTIASALIVSLGGVLQEPGEAYTVASDTITFASAPLAGTDCWILLYSEFGGQAGATTNLTIGNSLTVQGDTDLDGDIDIDAGQITYTASSNIAKFADNAKLIFGTGDDLQIYHDGSNSYINNTTGSLYIRDNGNNVYIQGNSGESSGIFRGNGEVELFHDGNRKFETTSTGVTVTGTALATALSTGASGTGINISTNTISGPATLTIDPAAVGDNTGTVIIAGDLQVDGTTTTINSTTLTVDDKNIVLASGAANAAAADGAGITVDGAAATLLYNATSDAWSFNKSVGIGTSDPLNPLHIKQNDATLLRLERDGIANAGIRFENDTGAMHAGLSSSATFFGIGTSNNIGSSATQLAVMRATGNVGIGHNSPEAKLHVSGGDLYVNSLDGNEVDIKLGIHATHSNFGVIKNVRASDSQNYLSFNIHQNGTLYEALQIHYDEGLYVRGNGSYNTTAYTGDVAHVLFGDQTRRFADIVVESESASSALGALVLKTKGSSFFPQERLRITSDGNVGIGTSDPQDLLSVGSDSLVDQRICLFSAANSAPESYGSIVFRYATANGNRNAKISAVRSTNSSSADLVFYTRTASDAVNNDGGEERVRIDQNGNVGIGTSNPGHKLHVEGDVRAQGGALILNYADADNIDHLWHDDTTEYGTPGSFVFNSDTTYKNSTGGTLSNIKVGHVFVDNGNLGTTVGNTQDLARFYANNGNATSIRIQAKRKVAGTSWTSAGYKIFCHTDATEQGYIEFNPHTTAVGDGNYDVAIGSKDGEIARFTTEGNVGIGTTAPTELLTLGSTATSNHYIRVNSANNSDSGIKFYSDLSATKGYAAGYRGNGNLFFIQSDNAGTTADRLVINDSGNVGIGTGDPQNKLHVKGPIQLDGTSAALNNNFSRIYQNSSSTIDYGLQLRHYQGDTGYVDASITIGGNGSTREDNIVFYRSNGSGASTETMRLDENGNVGIGTDGPAYLAHIHNPGTGTGDHAYLHFTTGDTGSTGSDGLTVGVGADQTAYINYREAGSLVLSASGTEKVRITSGFGGNLLVGMDTVYNVNATAQIRAGINIVASDENGDVTQVNLAGEPVGRILFGDTRPGKYAEINCIADGVCGTNDYPGRLVFRTTPDGGSNTVERMRISSDGNVYVAMNLGVGTSNPTTKLEVVGDITVTNGTQENGIRTNSDGKLQFMRNSVSNNTPAVTIDDENGNVGIGTDNPQGRLHVEAGNSYAYFKTNTDGVAPVSSVSGLAIGWNKNSGSRHVNFICNSGQAAINANGGFQFSTQTNTGTFQDQVIIKGDGNVGIGTTSPDYKLEVNGDIKVGELGTLWFSDVANSIEKIVSTSGTLGIYADSDIHFYESDTNVRKFTVDVNDGQLDLGSNLDTTTAQVHFDYHATSYINGSKFGLGTTSPTANLQVEFGATSYASDTIRIGTTNDLNVDNIYSLGWGDPNTTKMGIGPYSTTRSVFSGRHGLAIHIDGADEFSVRSNGWNKLFGVEGGTGRGYFQGNVGIGVTDPTCEIDMTGHMEISGSAIGGILTTVVADDAYVDVTTPIKGGQLVITPFSTYDAYPQPVGSGMMYYDVGNSRIIATIVDTELQRNGTAKLFASTSTSTTVTDFTDGAITVSAPATSTLRIFNRAGSARQFKIVFL